MSKTWMFAAGISLPFVVGAVSWEMLVGGMIGLLIVMAIMPFAFRRHRPKYLRATLWDSVRMERALRTVLKSV